MWLVESWVVKQGYERAIALYADFQLCGGHYSYLYIVQRSTVYKFLHTYVHTNTHIYVLCAYKCTQIHIFL